MRVSRFLAAALFAAGAVAVVEAQPGGRQQGGFGGGVHGMVLNNKALQDELKVTDEQKEKLKAVADKQAEQNKKRGEALKEAGGDREKMKDLFAEMQKGNEKLQAEIKTAVDAALTADQKKRLQQIERQMGGVRALATDELAAELKLTDDQKTKIKGIADEYQKDSRELFGRGGFGGGKGGFDKDKMEENQKKREKLTKAATADVEDVLTADQKKQWKEMTGEPFDTTKLFQGFGGQGGGRRPNTKKTD